jgi:flagellar biosynthesis/type III secretory pathway protein FliH
MFNGDIISAQTQNIIEETCKNAGLSIRSDMEFIVMEAVRDAYKHGYDDGRADGYEEGKSDGFKEGVNDSRINPMNYDSDMIHAIPSSIQLFNI